MSLYYLEIKCNSEETRDQYRFSLCTGQFWEVIHPYFYFDSYSTKLRPCQRRWCILRWVKAEGKKASSSADHYPAWVHWHGRSSSSRSWYQLGEWSRICNENEKTCIAKQVYSLVLYRTQIGCSVHHFIQRCYKWQVDGASTQYWFWYRCLKVSQPVRIYNVDLTLVIEWMIITRASSNKRCTCVTTRSC